MLQTLLDVIADRASLVSQLELEGKVKEGRTKLFNSARMDGVVVLDDLIMKRYLEYLYTYNAHVAPHCLPGMGMTTGDIVNHEGLDYLTLRLGVMVANFIVLHAVREHEALYIEWAQKREAMNRRVKAFTEEVCTLKSGCFGIEDFAGFEEIEGFVGWFDSGTPSPKFIKVLEDFSTMMNRHRKQGMRPLAREASAIIQELNPYSIFQDFLWKLRKDHGHKGFPYIAENMLYFPTPAASGGATMHSCGPNDDLAYARPTYNNLFIVAAQAGNTGVVHIGAGSKPGEHYFMLPPRTPFFSLIQEKVDGDQKLKDLWPQVSQFDGDKEVVEKRAMEWLTATIDIKGQVIKEIVPQLIGEHVLGWHVDMNQENMVALMRPVVAESHYTKHKEEVDASGLCVIRPYFKALVVGGNGGYGEMKSVFPSPTEQENPSTSATA